MSANLPHQTSMRYFSRLKRPQARIWATKLARKVAETPDRPLGAILTGLGMDDPDMQADVLKQYGRLLEEDE